MLHGPKLRRAYQPLFMVPAEFSLPACPRACGVYHAESVRLVALQDVRDSGRPDVEGQGKVFHGPIDAVAPALAAQIERHDALRNVLVGGFS